MIVDFGAGLLGFDCEELLLRLNLDGLTRPPLLEPAQEHPVRLLDGLELRPEGFELFLPARAALMLLLERPFRLMELLLVVDELPLVVPVGEAVPLVRGLLRGLVLRDPSEGPIGISDAAHGCLRIAAL